MARIKKGANGQDQTTWPGTNSRDKKNGQDQVIVAFLATITSTDISCYN